MRNGVAIQTSNYDWDNFLKNAVRTKKLDTYRRVARTKQGYDQQRAVA